MEQGCRVGKADAGGGTGCNHHLDEAQKTHPDVCPTPIADGCCSLSRYCCVARDGRNFVWEARETAKKELCVDPCSMLKHRDRRARREKERRIFLFSKNKKHLSSFYVVLFLSFLLIFSPPFPFHLNSIPFPPLQPCFCLENRHNGTTSYVAVNALLRL